MLVQPAHFSQSHLFCKFCCEEKDCWWPEGISGKVGHRIFFFFLVEHRGTQTCLLCKKKVSVHKEYNIIITQLHMLRSTQNTGEMREWTGSPILKTCPLRRQDFFNKASKENDVAIKASLVVTLMIAMLRQPFKEGESIPKCTLLAASIVCPDKKVQFKQHQPFSQERISDLSGVIDDQQHEKDKSFPANSAFD